MQTFNEKAVVQMEYQIFAVHIELLNVAAVMAAGLVPEEAELLLVCGQSLGHLGMDF